MLAQVKAVHALRDICHISLAQQQNLQLLSVHHGKDCLDLSTSLFWATAISK